MIENKNVRINKCLCYQIIDCSNLDGLDDLDLLDYYNLVISQKKNFIRDGVDFSYLLDDLNEG